MCDNLEESNEDGREPLDVVVFVDERCDSGRSDAVGVTVTGTLNGDVDEETEPRVYISLASGGRASSILVLISGGMRGKSSSSSSLERKAERGKRGKHSLRECRAEGAVVGHSHRSDVIEDSIDRGWGTVLLSIHSGRDIWAHVSN